MRNSFFLLLLWTAGPLHAQLIQELGLSLGPKMEFNQADHPAIEVQPHVDAAFNLFVTRRFNDHWRVHALLGQRNFSAKYQVTYEDPWVERSHTFFSNSVQAQFTSIQLALFPSYSVLLSPQWEWWTGAGLQFYLVRQLDDKNPGPLVDYIRDANNEPISNSTLYLFKTELGPGNYFIRAETGIVRHFTERISLEASLYGLTSTLEHHRFSLRVVDASGEFPVNDQPIINRGMGIGLNIGMRIQLQGPSSNDGN